MPVGRWPSWPILGNLGSFGQFWLIMAIFIKFWLFWPISVIFDQFWQKKKEAENRQEIWCDVTEKQLTPYQGHPSILFIKHNDEDGVVGDLKTQILKLSECYLIKRRKDETRWTNLNSKFGLNLSKLYIGHINVFSFCFQFSDSENLNENNIYENP